MSPLRPSGSGINWKFLMLGWVTRPLKSYTYVLVSKTLLSINDVLTWIPLGRVVHVDLQFFISAAISQEYVHHGIICFDWTPNTWFKLHLGIFLCVRVHGLRLVALCVILAHYLFSHLVWFWFHGWENYHHLSDVSDVARFISVHEIAMLCSKLTHLEGGQLRIVLTIII